MSLIIALHLGEGIVMASDSRTTFSTTIHKQDGTIVQNNGVHYSDSSYKTFLTPKGVGISTCGQASINNKPIAGYIESFINEHKDESVDEIKDKIIPYFKALCQTIDTDFIIGGYINTGKTYEGKFYQFNLSSCIRQQNSLTAQFVSFSLSNLANIFYPPQFLQ